MYYIITYGFMAAFMALVLMWLDTKLLDNPKERSTYLKNMGMAGLVTAAIVSFIGEDNLGHVKMRGGGIGVSYLPTIKEEIMTGPANF